MTSTFNNMKLDLPTQVFFNEGGGFKWTNFVFPPMKQYKGGFNPVESCSSIFLTVREFFTSIKKIGAANSNKENYCQRPSLFRELINIYDTEYRDESGVKATYHCLCFKIKKHD